MGYVAEHLLLTTSYQEARQRLGEMTDEELIRVIRPRNISWCLLPRQAWHADDPEFDLVIREIRQTLAADLSIVYEGMTDPHNYGNYELLHGFLPRTTTRIVTVIVDDGLDEDVFDDAMAANPVARLSVLYPLCGESDNRPRRRTVADVYNDIRTDDPNPWRVDPAMYGVSSAQPSDLIYTGQWIANDNPSTTAVLHRVEGADPLRRLLEEEPLND